MSALEKIRMGILSGSMDLVKEGYALLTGENLEVTLPETTTESGIEHRCNGCGHTVYFETRKKKCPSCERRRLVVAQTDTVVDTASQANEMTPSSTIPTREQKRFPGEARFDGNTWADNSQENREDKRVDKILTGHLVNKVRHRRPEVGMKKMVCRGCQQTVQVRSNLVLQESYFRCDKCCMRPT